MSISEYLQHQRDITCGRKHLLYPVADQDHIFKLGRLSHLAESEINPNVREMNDRLEDTGDEGAILLSGDVSERTGDSFTPSKYTGYPSWKPLHWGPAWLPYDDMWFRYFAHILFGRQKRNIQPDYGRLFVVVQRYNEDTYFISEGTAIWCISDETWRKLVSIDWRCSLFNYYPKVGEVIEFRFDNRHVHQTSYRYDLSSFFRPTRPVTRLWLTPFTRTCVDRSEPLSHVLADEGLSLSRIFSYEPLESFNFSTVNVMYFHEFFFQAVNDPRMIDRISFWYPPQPSAVTDPEGRGEFRAREMVKLGPAYIVMDEIDVMGVVMPITDSEDGVLDMSKYVPFDDTAPLDP